MSRINVLSTDICQLISAGEVITSTASVVKELVENSIDAGAKKVDVAIENGGKSLIKVIDDGCGIEEGDIEKAFLKNATSKISSKEDIHRILTMGFRGEALFSVALVSNVEIVSKSDHDDIATKLILSASKVVRKEHLSANRGTILTVKDLFFNIPARRKHLKEDRAEASGVIDILSKLAIGNLDVKISLTSNSREIFSTPGNGSIKDAIACIFSYEYVKKLIAIEFEEAPLRLSGMIMLPNKVDDEHKQEIVYYVNKRYVKLPKLNSYIENVYKTHYGVEKFGAVLFITLPPDMIDVNVHPTKLNVSLRNETLIYMLIAQSVKETLDNHFKVNDFKDIVYKRNGNIEAIETQQNSYTPADESRTAAISSTNFYDKESTEPFVAKEMPPKKVVEKYEQTSFDRTGLIAQDAYFEYSKEKESETQLFYRELKNSKFIGIVFGLYALFEKNDALYAMDTHAAHERVLYEKCLEQLNDKDIPSAKFLVGNKVFLSAMQMHILTENIETLKHIGFTIQQDFQENSAKITAAPSFFEYADSEEFLKCALNDLINIDRISTPINRNERLLKYACHTSVRGKSNLSFDEVQKLLSELAITNSPFECPHGRPILSKIENKDFQKVFKRL